MRPILVALLVGGVVGGAVTNLAGLAGGLTRFEGRIARSLSREAAPAADAANAVAAIPTATAGEHAMSSAADRSDGEGGASFVDPSGRSSLSMPRARPAFVASAVASHGQGSLRQEGGLLALGVVPDRDIHPFPAPVRRLALAGIPPGSAFAVQDELPFRNPASRVVVHAPRSLGSPRGNRALARLATGPWSAGRLVTTPYTISTTHVRYYHHQDRAAAEELAAVFDAGVRDFTGYSPSPDEGLLELWLSGEGVPSGRGRGGSASRGPNILEQITTVIRDNFSGR